MSKKYEGRFDDQRILDGNVTGKEIFGLEKKLLKRYLRNAEQDKKKVIILSDLEKYTALHDSGEVFQRDRYYLFINEQGIDMRPVVQRFLDTKEGLFYAKLMQLETHRLY